MQTPLDAWHINNAHIICKSLKHLEQKKKVKDTYIEVVT